MTSENHQPRKGSVHNADQRTAAGGELRQVAGGDHPVTTNQDQLTDKQTAVDASPDPAIETPGVLVAGPEARSRVDPAAEDAYWRTHYVKRPYVDRGTPGKPRQKARIRLGNSSNSR